MDAEMGDQTEIDMNGGGRINYADYTARGMAQEAMQLCRSHEAQDGVQFKAIADTLTDFKQAFRDHNDLRQAGFDAIIKEMRDGFKSYDNKFWSLAIMLITMLVGAVGALVYAVIFHVSATGHMH